MSFSSAAVLWVPWSKSKPVLFLPPLEIHFIITVRCWKIHLTIMIGKWDFKDFKGVLKGRAIYIKSSNFQTFWINSSQRDPWWPWHPHHPNPRQKYYVLLWTSCNRFHSFTHAQQLASSSEAPGSGSNRKAKVSFQLWEWPWTQVQPNHWLALCLGFPIRPDLSGQTWSPQTHSTLSPSCLSCYCNTDK